MEKSRGNQGECATDCKTGQLNITEAKREQVLRIMKYIIMETLKRLYIETSPAT